MPERRHQEHGPAQDPARVTIATAGGHTIVLDDATGTVSVTHSGGSSVTITATGIQVEAVANVAVSAPSVSVAAPMTKFSGVVQCDTLIANSVVAASYTPGAGNIW